MAPHPHIEQVLSSYIATLERRTISATTRMRLAQALLDWFTAGWSALALPGARIYQELGMDLYPEPGKSSVFGLSRATGALGAGFANGAIAHLREIDDTHRAATLHPGIVAISPVLALAQAAPIPRARIVAGIIAGYEVAQRYGEALGQSHYQRFHSTATAGALGAAAASAVTLGLGAEQVHHAIGIAATQAAGLWQIVDDGAHDSKALHPAFAVRNGMAAAYAARAGLPGATRFFSGERGLYALLHGGGDLAAVTADLGVSDRICEASIKAWPTCGQIFTALDCTAALMAKHRPELAQIDEIEVRTYPQALKVANVIWPTRSAEATFSPRYCVSALLYRQKLGLDEMGKPLIDDPALLALAKRVSLVADPEHERAFPKFRPCTVTLRMKDGARLTHTSQTRRGDPEDPFDWQQMEERTRMFAPNLPCEKRRRLADWCLAFADQTQDQSPLSASPDFFH